MKNRLLSGILTLVSLGLFALNADAQFSSGTGVSGDPYVITTAAQLNDVRNYPSSYFRLGNDIDLETWLTTNSPTAGWDPIGTAASYFSGNFDGNGYSINGLWIDRPTTNNIGLFGTVSGTVEIKNLGVNIATGKHIAGGDDVAGIVAYATNTVATTLKISNSYVSGTISGNKNVGAFIGYNNWAGATLENCYAKGSVTTTGDGCGGLIGNSWGGVKLVINKCYAYNQVSASASAGSGGGLLGGASASTASGINTTISNSFILNPTIDGKTANRIYGFIKSGAVINISNNYAFEESLVNGVTVSTGSANDINGLNKTAEELLQNNAQYSNLGWDFSAVWTLSNGTYPFPVLKTLALTNQPSALPTNLTYDVLLSASVGEGGGTITPASSSLTISGGVAGSQSFTITPDANYTVDKLLVNGVDKKNEISSGSYTLSNIINNQTLIVSFKTTTGLEFANADQLVVYPNPVKDILFVKGKEVTDKVLVYNSVGRIVLQSSDSQIDMSNLARGIYSVSINGKSVKIIKK
ncbi:MAG: T9SS type A sorting domain-containing protein [Dysgonomonas sp.]